MLAEAGVRVFGVERVDQQRVVRLDGSGWFIEIESGSGGHLRGEPAFLYCVQEGFVGCDHGRTLYFKVLHVNIANARKNSFVILSEAKDPCNLLAVPRRQQVA